MELKGSDGGETEDDQRNHRQRGHAAEDVEIAKDLRCDLRGDGQAVGRDRQVAVVAKVASERQRGGPGGGGRDNRGGGNRGRRDDKRGGRGGSEASGARARMPLSRPSSDARNTATTRARPFPDAPSVVTVYWNV